MSRAAAVSVHPSPQLSPHPSCRSAGGQQEEIALAALLRCAQRFSPRVEVLRPPRRMPRMGRPRCCSMCPAPSACWAARGRSPRRWTARFPPCSAGTAHALPPESALPTGSAWPPRSMPRRPSWPRAAARASACLRPDARPLRWHRCRSPCSNSQRTRLQRWSRGAFEPWASWPRCPRARWRRGWAKRCASAGPGPRRRQPSAGAQRRARRCAAVRKPGAGASGGVAGAAAVSAGRNAGAAHGASGAAGAGHRLAGALPGAGRAAVPGSHRTLRPTRRTQRRAQTSPHGAPRASRARPAHPAQAAAA